MPERLKKAKEFLLELIFPTFCLVCKKEDVNFVCTTCSSKLQPEQSAVCPICLKTESEFICSLCRAQTPLSSLTYCFSYEDKRVAHLIHALKYRSIHKLSEFFAEKMFQKVSYYPFNDSWIIIPVPLHWQRMNERGYNQSKLISAKLAARLHITLETTALVKTHYTKTQTKFSKEERRENLAGQFAVVTQEKVMGKNILLVDDVATTLATLEICATTLKGAGATNVWALTIARAK